MHLESSSAVYDMPAKGHDRVIRDDEKRFYASLDGAGGDELSASMAQTLPRLIDKYGELRATSPLEFMTQIAYELDWLPAADWRRATGALACIDEGEDGVSITYVNAGDSYLYLLDETNENFKLLAHSPTGLVRTSGGSFINTAEFWGAQRSLEQIREMVSQKIMPKTVEWSLLGCSDGVRDDAQNGIAAGEMAETMFTLPTAEVPSAILGSYRMYDDASLFVVRHAVELALPQQSGERQQLPSPY